MMIGDDLITGSNCVCVEMSFFCYVKGNRVCLLAIPMVCKRCLTTSLLYFLLRYLGGLFNSFNKQTHILSFSRVSEVTSKVS